MRIFRSLFWLVLLAAIGIVVLVGVRTGVASHAVSLVRAVAEHPSELSSLSAVRDDTSSLASAAESSLGQQVEGRVEQVLGVTRQQFSFDVIADIEPDYTIYGRHLDSIQHDGSRFLIVNGDITARGTTEQFEYFRAFTDERIDIPFHPVPGNHDILQDGDTSTYAGVFGHRFTSFDYGNAHFVLLDNASAARGFDDEQLAWLDADLRASNAAHTFVFMHRPIDVPFAQLVLGKENELKEENIQKLLDVLTQHDISAIFAAHVPGYLHYTLRSTGIPVYASGGGGSESSVSFVEQEYHYLHIGVHDSDFTVEKRPLAE